MSDPDFIDVLTKAIYIDGITPTEKIRAALRALVAYRNPSEPPKSSPSEWAQAIAELRGAWDGDDACIVSTNLRKAIDALLALGDPAPAAPASELPLLRELLGFLYGYYAVGEAIALKGAMQAQIKGLIARASAQAGGGS